MDLNQKAIEKILNEAGYTVKFDGTNVTATPSAAPASPTMTGLESFVNEAGGLDKFKEMFANLSKLPATVQALTSGLDEIKGSVEGVKVMAQNAAAEADAKKKETVARLVSNTKCPFDEATLNGMALDVLTKLDASYRDTNYSALGAVNFANANMGDEVLSTPTIFEVQS